MWVVITLLCIVCAVITCGIVIVLPMCKDCSELDFDDMRDDDVVCAASSEPKEDNGGDSALNIENLEIKE